VWAKWQLPNRLSAVRGHEAEKDKIPGCFKRKLTDYQVYNFKQKRKG